MKAERREDARKRKKLETETTTETETTETDSGMETQGWNFFTFILFMGLPNFFKTKFNNL